MDLGLPATFERSVIGLGEFRDNGMGQNPGEYQAQIDVEEIEGCEGGWNDLLGGMGSERSSVLYSNPICCIERDCSPFKIDTMLVKSAKSEMVRLESLRQVTDVAKLDKRRTRVRLDSVTQRACSMVTSRTWFPMSSGMWIKTNSQSCWTKNGVRLMEWKGMLRLACSHGLLTRLHAFNTGRRLLKGLRI